MKWKNIIVVITLPLMIGCGSHKKVNETIENIEQTELILVEHEIVAHNALFGGGEEQIVESVQVINTQADWESLKTKMNSINNVSDGFKVHDIDFSNHTVIAVFDQVRPSGGFSIKVKAVTESSTRLTVYVNKTSPEMPATSVLTQPYEIIMIEKTNLPVVIQ